MSEETFAQECRRMGLWLPRAHRRHQAVFMAARERGSEALRAAAKSIGASVVTCLGCGWISGFYDRNKAEFLSNPVRCDECGRRGGRIEPDESPGEYVLTFAHSEVP